MPSVCMRAVMSRASARAAAVRLPGERPAPGCGSSLQRGGELLAQRRQVQIGALEGLELRRAAAGARRAARSGARGACAPAPRSPPGALDLVLARRVDVERLAVALQLARRLADLDHRRLLEHRQHGASLASSAASPRSACSARLTPAWALAASFSYSSPSAACAPVARRPRLARRPRSSVRLASSPSCETAAPAAPAPGSAAARASRRGRAPCFRGRECG